MMMMLVMEIITMIRIVLKRMMMMVIGIMTMFRIML